MIAAPTILPTYSEQPLAFILCASLLFIFIFLREYSYQQLWIVFCFFQLFSLLDMKVYFNTICQYSL